MSETITSNTLPELTGEYPVSPEQTVAFQKNGHIVLPKVCSTDEVAAYGPVIIGAAARRHVDTRPMEERNTFERAFTLVGGIWYQDEAVARFTLSRRFAKIAADLMGVDAVRVYHDVAINKEAGGGYTPWHQDHLYWPMDTPNTITMWMPLVDVSLEMGALVFARGSHKDGDLGDEAISDFSHEYFEKIVQERGFPKSTTPLAAGDASFHAGWTLHSAPGNQSDRARQVITVVYYADGVNVFADIGNPHREADFRAYMPGVKPGEPAASPRNPVVYRRTDG